MQGSYARLTVLFQVQAAPYWYLEEKKRLAWIHCTMPTCAHAESRTESWRLGAQPGELRLF